MIRLSPLESDAIQLISNYLQPLRKEEILVVCINPLFIGFFIEIAKSISNKNSRITLLTDTRIDFSQISCSLDNINLIQVHPEIELSQFSNQLENLEFILNIDIDIILTMSTFMSIEWILFSNIVNTKIILINPHAGDSINKSKFSLYQSQPLKKYLLLLASITLSKIYYHFNLFGILNKFINSRKDSLLRDFKFSEFYSNMIFQLAPLLALYNLKYYRKIKINRSLFVGISPDIHFTFSKSDENLYSKFFPNTNYVSLWQPQLCKRIDKKFEYDILFYAPSMVLPNPQLDILLKSISIILKSINIKNIYLKQYPFYGFNLDHKNSENVWNFYSSLADEWGWIVNDAPLNEKVIMLSGANSSVFRWGYRISPIIQIPYFPYTEVGDCTDSLGGTYTVNMDSESLTLIT